MRDEAFKKECFFCFVSFYIVTFLRNISWNFVENLQENLFLTISNAVDDLVESWVFRRELDDYLIEGRILIRASLEMRVEEWLFSYPSRHCMQEGLHPWLMPHYSQSSCKHNTNSGKFSRNNNNNRYPTRTTYEFKKNDCLHAQFRFNLLWSSQTYKFG